MCIRDGIYATKSLFSKKQKDSFVNVKKNNGIIGLDHDPFKFKGKKFYKPTGIEEDSFTAKHRKMAYSNKYDKESLKKKFMVRLKLFLSIMTLAHCF